MVQLIFFKIILDIIVLLIKIYVLDFRSNYDENTKLRDNLFF